MSFTASLAMLGKLLGLKWNAKLNIQSSSAQNAGGVDQHKKFDLVKCFVHVTKLVEDTWIRIL